MSFHLQDYRSGLAAEATFAAAHESRQAKLYPDDPRHRRSANALTKLAASLSGFPLDHPALGACYACEVEQWQDDEELFLFVEGLRDCQTEAFSRYGADRPEDGDAERFLAHYLAALASLAEAARAEAALAKAM